MQIIEKPNGINKTEPAVLTAETALSDKPCFFGTRQGITSCSRCRGKIVCKKSPEAKQ